MCIGSAPGCPKNSAYLERQALSFLTGKTPPDFPTDNFEVDFVGGGTLVDLTEQGRSQLGTSQANVSACATLRNAVSQSS